MLQPAHPPVEALAPVDTRVRFSLRGVFIAIAAIGAWLAAVAPWFREWNWDQRRAFLMVCGSTALGAISMTLFRSALRIRAERRAGVARFRLSQTITRFAFLFGVATGLFAFGLSMTFAFTQAIYTGVSTLQLFWISNLLAFHMGTNLAAAALGVWWKTTGLELCDDGILYGFVIQPWGNVRGFRWGGRDSHQLVLQWRRWGAVTVRVDASDKRAVEQFLDERLAATSRPQP